MAEVWRENADFRRAVLRYATRNAHRDPASIDLWPEVVYPLIERARWQREFRPKHEAVWDYLCDRVLHVPDAGRPARPDDGPGRSPSQVAEELDEEIAGFVDDPRLVERRARRGPGARGTTASPRGSAPASASTTWPTDAPARQVADRPGLARPVPVHPGRPPRPLARGARRPDQGPASRAPPPGTGTSRSALTGWP